MTVPECVHIPPLPEPLQSQTHSVLSMVRRGQGRGQLGGLWATRIERSPGPGPTPLPSASVGPGP